MPPLAAFGRTGIFRASLAEQRAALRDFWAKAAEALAGSGVRLRPLPAAWTRLGHNRFSVLFVATYRALGIAPPRRHLYAVLGHCLRSWVTACDNLLDGDRRETVLTDLPAGAGVFKAAHTILVADRVAFLALLEAEERGVLTREEARRLAAVTLAAISASGRQEAEEEDGIGRRLRPAELLRDVHGRKAGDLFAAPLAAPAALGDAAGPRLEAMRRGLRAFGVAVQILDDCADLNEDLRRGRQNYLASLAAHGPEAGERRLVAGADRDRAAPPATAPWKLVPGAFARARETARTLFAEGIDELCRGGLPLTRLERAALLAGLRALAADPGLANRLRAR